MNAALLALYGEALGAGELTPGTFSVLFPTEFDKAVTAIIKYINLNYQKYPSKKEVQALLADYIELARKRNEPYLQAKYEIWLKDLMSAGNNNILTGHFLHALRIQAAAGEVPAIVFQPWTYTADDSTWLEKFLKEIKTGTRILYFVAVGVLALALWGWIAPRRGLAPGKTPVKAGGA